ncbi:MAG: hypothetical protein IPO16_12195 [Saprospiraceae bacterium]|nr:hypothetical protein [Saprospiraceae bacterium]
MKYIVLFLLLPFLAFSQIKPALPAGRGVSPILNSHNGSSENTYAVVVGISDYQDPAFRICVMQIKMQKRLLII